MWHLLGFAVLVCAPAATVAADLVFNPAQIAFEEVWAALAGQPIRPIAQLIVGSVRLLRTITTCLTGAALGVTGLAMQTLFRNPPASPFILGIPVGSSLSVTTVILVVGSGGVVALATELGFGGDLTIAVASAIDSGTVMTMVLFMGYTMHSLVTLLPTEVMIGYLISAGVSVTMSFPAPQPIVAYSRWGFGSYGGVIWANLPLISAVTGIELVISLTLLRPLNALLLGEHYVQSVGLNPRAACMALIALVLVLTGTTTASYGPIQFLGTAVPHLARGMFNTSDHRVLIPVTVLTRALLALATDVIAGLPGDSVPPLNAINAALGAPVIIWILLQHRRAVL